jgi:hypothetical protein
MVIVDGLWDWRLILLGSAARSTDAVDVIGVTERGPPAMRPLRHADLFAATRAREADTVVVRPIGAALWGWKAFLARIRSEKKKAGTDL